VQALFCLIILLAVLFPPFNIFKTESESSHIVHASRVAHLPANYRNVSGTFTIPSAGFGITLPPGWSGIDLGSLALLGPTGINPKTGVLNPSSNLTNVFLILAWHNSSDVLRNRHEWNLTSYHDYVKRSAERIGCKVLSDRFVQINGISSERVDGKCGRQEEVSMETYSIAAGKNIISIGLKGITAAFDYNHESFMRSLNTIKVDSESDIRKLISEYYQPD
jgi:hypothetical protein